MSLHTSPMSSPLHPLHIPHRPPSQNFFYNPHSTATPPLLSPNSASTLPPLPSPSGCSTPPPNNMSPLQSPHQPPAFPTLPLFNTTTAARAGGFYNNSHKRFKHDGSHHQSNNNNNSLMFPHVPMQKHYSNRTSSLHHHHQNMDSGLFYPLKTELRSNFNDDGLLENMLEEAQVMASANNKEMQKQEQEDYSRLINDNGPSSMGKSINDWCNDSGESSDRQHSVITDKDQNHIAVDMHNITSLFLVDISTNHAAGSSSDRSWDNFGF